MRAVKLSRLKGVGIGPKMERCVNMVGPIAMVPCLHQGNVYFKRKLWVWRDKKRVPLVCANTLLTCADRQTPLTCAGCQTTTSQGSRSSPENGNLRKLGWTYRHGTVFAPRQYLYQTEATGMEKPEMYSPSWCKSPSYQCRRSNHPISRESV